jgi:hypothetical protein
MRSMCHRSSAERSGGTSITISNDFNGAAQAVQAALNTHASLAAGLRDAVSRLTSVDNAR